LHAEEITDGDLRKACNLLLLSNGEHERSFFRILAERMVSAAYNRRLPGLCEALQLKRGWLEGLGLSRR
jgi:hypothetical protein